MPDRRLFLCGSISSLCAPLFSSPAFSLNQSNYKIMPRRSRASLLENTSIKTDVWAYYGLVPGPTIKARRGEEVVIEVFNGLEQPTTIHWHGIRIDNAMDGVAGLTQSPIKPGESFIYRFTPPDAGTYWYHPHNRTWEQLARGLYGTLIVEGDAEADSFDRDYTIVADDWRVDKSGLLHEESLGSLHDWSHAGRLGNILTLNGKAYEQLSVTPSERVRLRFINASNARVMKFAIDQHNPWLVALDGQPIPAQKLGVEGITLAPAQRADLVFDVKGSVGDKIPIFEASGSEKLIAGYLVCKEGKTVTRNPSQVPSLRTNQVAEPDTSNSKELELVMSGGAMRFLTSGVYKGEKLGGRELAEAHKQLWTFNGVAGMPDVPFFIAKTGETIRLKIFNDTAWPHSIHLHGHHFRVLARGPTGSGLTPVRNHEKLSLRDTVLLDRDEIVEIALVADNVGKWMLHCHMLEHQAGGMGTWFEVI